TDVGWGFEAGCSKISVPFLGRCIGPRNLQLCVTAINCFHDSFRKLYSPIHPRNGHTNYGHWRRDRSPGPFQTRILRERLRYPWLWISVVTPGAPDVVRADSHSPVFLLVP